MQWSCWLPRALTFTVCHPVLLHIPPDSLDHHLIKVYGLFCTLPWSCWTLPPVGNVFIMHLNFSLQQSLLLSEQTERWEHGMLLSWSDGLHHVVHPCTVGPSQSQMVHTFIVLDQVYNLPQKVINLFSASLFQCNNCFGFARLGKWATNKHHAKSWKCFLWSLEK